MVGGRTSNTGGSRGSWLYHAVAAVALEHDLPPVLDLPHVGPVLVQPHVADQQDLPVLDEAREGTVDLFTPGSQPGPVAEVALGGVVPLQHVAVTTLATDSKQLICMREIISNNT